MAGFEAVSLQVEAKEVTMEDLIAKGLELREQKDNISWELGDLAILVTKEFGPKELNSFAKGIGVEVSTIRRYRDVAKAYTVEQREAFKRLPWSAFRMVAAKENRMELLEQAHDESWSVEKLGVVATNPDAITDGVVPPKPELVFDRVCRRWGFLYPEEAKNLCPNDGSCEYENA